MTIETGLQTVLGNPSGLGTIIFCFRDVLGPSGNRPCLRGQSPLYQSAGLQQYR